MNRTPCSDRSDASDSRLEYRTTVHLPAVATKSRDSLARPARDRVSGAASGQVPTYLPLLGGIEGFGIVGHDHRQKTADGAAAWLEKQKEAADRTKQKYVKMAEHINRPSALVMPPIHHKPQMTNAADGADIWKTEKIIKEKQAANRIHLGNIISEIKAEIIDHGKLMVPSEGHFRSSTPPGLATCNMRSASLDNVFGFGNLSDAAREEELDRRRQEMADKREQERKVKGRKGEKKGGKKLKKRED
ncbi:uncharacterized protein LOC127834046 [Dreissena polymorpha]|uniref:uncharacterized protein LOC127834046 n=1 Tax=Dreissena polymorpha TaxID=45954 RepID=UPI0022652870|nr:uncharacterized protein LOC127834046 [Dreissena polymorpha]